MGEILFRGVAAFFVANMHTMWKIVAILVNIIPVGSPALDVGNVTDDEVQTFDDGMMDVGVDGDDNCDEGFTQTDLCESTLAE